MAKQHKYRLVLCALIMLIAIFCIFGRLIWLQFLKSGHSQDKLTTLSHATMKTKRLRAKRGEIVDRFLKHRFAYDDEVYALTLDKKAINDKDFDGVVAKIALKLDVDADRLQIRLHKTQRHLLLRNKDGVAYFHKNEVEDLLKDKDLKPILHAQLQMKRQYGSYATHTIGYLDEDGRPRGGIEAYYNDLLQGKDGYMVYPKTKKGIMISNEPIEQEEPSDGDHVVLTIDTGVQHVVEKILGEHIEKSGAKGGAAIFMEPQNGGIVALASLPSFDNNKYASTVNNYNQRHRAVSAIYEPGSIFKIFTLAAALEENLFEDSKKFRSEAIKVGHNFINEWKKTGFGHITYKEGFEKSSNILFVLLNQQLQEERFLQYLTRFGLREDKLGLGTYTGIDLPGETRSFLPRSPIPEEQLASMSFGQGIAINLLHQLVMTSAVTQDGFMYTPHVMKEIRTGSINECSSSAPIDYSKCPIKSTYPIKSRQVMSVRTASHISNLLQGVVERGTGKAASVDGYCVSGKTGTAQKAENGKYLDDKYVVSFTGFAPCTYADLSFIVLLDEPQKIDIVPSMISQMLTEILPLRGIMPQE